MGAVMDVWGVVGGCSQWGLVLSLAWEWAWDGRKGEGRKEASFRKGGVAVSMVDQQIHIHTPKLGPSLVVVMVTEGKKGSWGDGRKVVSGGLRWPTHPCMTDRPSGLFA